MTSPTTHINWKKSNFDSDTYCGAVHRTGYIDESGRFGAYRDDHRNDWCLVHLATGYSVAYLRSLENCKALVGAVWRLDWEFRSPNSRKLKALGGPVKRAVSRIEPERKTLT